MSPVVNYHRDHYIAGSGVLLTVPITLVAAGGNTTPQVLQYKIFI